MACRRIADSLQRLVCYDAVQGPAGAAAPAAPAPITPAPAQPAPAEKAAPVQQGMGLFQAEVIETQLEEDVPGWSPNYKIRLTNGQVWQVSDDSSGTLRRGPRKVIIRRSFLGAYYMDIEGVANPIRVTRAK